MVKNDRFFFLIFTANGKIYCRKFSYLFCGKIKEQEVHNYFCHSQPYLFIYLTICTYLLK